MTYEEEIAEPRKKINSLNAEILDAIKRRLDVAEEIAIIKKKYGKPVFDSKREKAVIHQVRELAAERGIDVDSVEKVFLEIMHLTVKLEEETL